MENELKKTLESLYFRVYYKSPRGTEMYKYVSFAIGVNKWVVDVETYTKERHEEVYSVIVCSKGDNMRFFKDKVSAKLSAESSLMELGQWI